MKYTRTTLLVTLALGLAGCGQNTSTADQTLQSQALARTLGVNVLLNGPITPALLQELGRFGRVRDTLPSLNALTLQTTSDKLDAIRAHPAVKAANPDAERHSGPVTAAAATESFVNGISTWNLDAVDVTEFGSTNRVVNETGAGVYVAVLDTGLVNNWPSYFPAARIATQYARSFGGGGGEVGNVSEQPNKWGQDQNSHGTHVTSTIIGFKLGSSAVNGVAPEATIIPVKVLNQNGSGWSSVVARGISYVTELKEGPLRNHPVVINMSLGGSVLDAIEKAAIDRAIAAGVIIVASGGNSGMSGMGYPGGYEPVISVAASGWKDLFASSNPLRWRGNTPDPLNVDDYFIAGFSSRDISPNTELDVVAPGHRIVGPYETNGQLSYYYLSGTSMAAPHVAGLAALMAQKKPALTAAQAEEALKRSAVPLPAGSRHVAGEGTLSWGDDATGSGLVTAPRALGALD